MASLASYTTLHVTAVRIEGGAELKNIGAVRWDGGDDGPEESSVADFIRWLDRGGGRAFVRRADGGRGPRIRVEHDGVQRCLRSRTDDNGQHDALLQLPRWQVRKTATKHMSRR
jgi:hypothetical protein